MTTAATATEKDKPTDPEDDEDQILDLTLPTTRRMVKLPTKAHPEGEPYELRLLDDFGIADQQQLLAWSRRFDGLFNLDEADNNGPLTDDQKLIMKKCLDSLFDMVIVAPAAVKKAMPDSIRHRVVTAFTLAPLIARQEAQAKAEVEAAKQAQTEGANGRSTTES